MSCIYYIYNKNGARTRGGYVGQDSSNDYTRIADHVFNAYDGKLNYGSERLIRDNSACNCWFDIYGENNKNGYGLSTKTYDLFWQHWGSGDFTSQKLNIAEILHIAYHRIKHGDESVLNVQIGGQDKMPFKYKWSEEQIRDLKALATELKVPEGIIDTEIELSIGKFDKADAFQKLINPFEYRIVRLITKHYLSHLFEQPLFINLIKNILVSKLLGNNVNTQVRIRNFIKTEVIDQINAIITKSGIRIKSFTPEEFDLDNVANKIIKVFEDKISRKTLLIHNISDPALITTEVVEQIFQRIQGTLKGQTFTIKIPQGWTKNIEIERTSCDWWTSLEEDMKSLSSSPQEEQQAINAAKTASYKFFKQIVAQEKTNNPILSITPFTTYEIKNGLETFIRGGYADQDLSNQEYRTQGLFGGKSASLRWRIRDQYESHNIHGGLLHFWDKFYRQAISTLMHEVKQELTWKEDALNSNRQIAVSADGEREYSFISTTADEIKRYHSFMISDLQFY